MSLVKTDAQFDPRLSPPLLFRERNPGHKVFHLQVIDEEMV
ncbi:MAG TPA: hypothetical protein VFC29_09765 [Candidatus Limnocylindrales bacterium]|nr:hypothetical protein [Candidatus Limnocylindrales bacterium]